jgi:hypothetical protein
MEKNRLRNAIDSLVGKDAPSFRGSVRTELFSRIHGTFDSLRQELSRDIISENLPGAPSAPPVTKPIKAGDLKIVPTAAGAAKDDMSLDPNFEKEFFQSSSDYKGQRITVKQLGTGFGKPVRIYINDRRWEFFPGPKVGIKAAKDYIDGMVKDVRKDPQLAAAMTAQIAKDKAAGVSTVAAPVDAGKPNEVADANLKQKELETGQPVGKGKPPAQKPPAAAKPKAAPKPPAPPKPKPTKEVKPK